MENLGKLVIRYRDYRNSARGVSLSCIVLSCIIEHVISVSSMWNSWQHIKLTSGIVSLRMLVSLSHCLISGWDAAECDNGKFHEFRLSSIVEDLSKISCCYNVAVFQCVHFIFLTAPEMSALQEPPICTKRTIFLSRHSG